MWRAALNVVSPLQRCQRFSDVFCTRHPAEDSGFKPRRTFLRRTHLVHENIERDKKKNFPQLNQSEKCKARKTGRILGQNVKTGSSKHNTMKPRQSNQQERASTNRPSSPGYRRDVNNQDCDNSKSPFQPSIQCCLYKQCIVSSVQETHFRRALAHTKNVVASVNRSCQAFVYDSATSGSIPLHRLRLSLTSPAGCAAWERS